MSLRNEELLVEEDEAGKVYRRYTYTKDMLIVSNGVKSADRGLAKGVLHMLSDVFMPAGYPNSVSADYFEYQLFDSLQAFSSSIAGLLASRAVLEGFGVGDASASATQALLLTITQDAVSRLATIMFAWRIGTALEPEAKRYRLLADIFNDGAMILDCLSPALPKHVRLFSLCVSGSLRALCGVAAGGAKAALSVHFARANNVGDLNAKDSSQETVIGLLGMLAGSFVVSHATTQTATWTLLLLLLAIHLSTNYFAVRAVTMSSLNRQRANLVYARFRVMGSVQSPAEVAKAERIFAAGGMLHDVKRKPIGWCEIGARLDHLLQVPKDGSPALPLSAQRTLQIFTNQKYILWASSPKGYFSTRHYYNICLEKGAGASDHLKAWVHAMELAHMVNETGPIYMNSDRLLELLEDSLLKVNDIFPTLLQALVTAGWDVNNPALVTRPSFRISRTANAAWTGGRVESKKSK